MYATSPAAPAPSRPSRRTGAAVRYAPKTLLQLFTPIMLAGVLVVYLVVLWPWMLHWGATRDEQAATLAPATSSSPARLISPRARS
jgi:hypothetical protein